MNTAALDLFALVLLALLAVVMPLMGIWEFSRLKGWLAAGRPDARLATYRWVLAMEWILTLGLLGWWLGLGRGAEPLGLVVAAAGWQWLAIGLGLALAALQVQQTFATLGRADKLAELRGKIGSLEDFAPHTPAESTVFSALSITAGICEEIVYRGMLLAVLTPAVGLWAAVVLSSLIFGLGHVYQGAGGVLKTSVVGFVMALLVVFSGSLWTAMILHAVIDLTSGKAMAAALAMPEE